MLSIVENAPLAPLTTFHIGGHARFLITISSADDIPKAASFAQQKNLPLHVLGGGANTIFGDTVIDRVILKMEASRITCVSESDTNTLIEIEAGTPWHEVINWAVQNNVSGIEALAGIPGTAGAAPVQNIGAYGQEIKNTLVKLHAYDTYTNSFVILPASACSFGYRTSIFNTSQRGRYIITSIYLTLSKQNPSIPAYPDIEAYISGQQKNISPTLHDIVTAIIKIRATKLPDLNTLPSAGSFFKNPVISLSHAHEIQKKYPQVKLFPVSDVEVKIPAGWLIETCGFKGSSLGPIGVYEKNALVLTNLGGATQYDILHARDIIIETVYNTFAITLTMEPELII